MAQLDNLQPTEICPVSTRTKTPLVLIASGSRSPTRVCISRLIRWSHWLTHAVTFVNITDPYADDPLDPALTSPDASLAAPLQANWAPEVPYRGGSSQVTAHGLEALSAAASRDRASFPHPQASHLDMATTAISYMTQNLHNAPSFPISTRRPTQLSHSPTTSMSSINNINFLLNPQGSLSPPIDPCLRNPPEVRDASIPAPSILAEPRVEQPVESDQEVAYLLRHFAEAPGSW
jgi:hypothetical protein